ncbi:MAG TPA: sugar dehydratase, partial [Blastocatellia bacterium]|nr:sugar dehydratase [Blastocatellia bacterium]
EQYSCSEKARKMLGWTPRYTFAAGLEETIDWYQNYLEGS